MGTRVSIDVRGCEPATSAAVAIGAAIRWLHWVDDEFSLFQDTSALSRHRRGHPAPDDPGLELIEVLALAEWTSALSGGGFDPYWRGDGAADPTGVVKGWAAQRAAEILARHGSTSSRSGCCVNAAGDLWAHGRPAPDREWALGITDPLQPGRLAAVVHGADLAVATSGTAEQGDHIVDPRSGRPATAVASATVIGHDLGIADGLATAGVALGVDGPDALGPLDAEGWGSLLIFADGTRWSSPGFARQAEIPGGGGGWPRPRTRPRARPRPRRRPRAPSG